MDHLPFLPHAEGQIKAGMKIASGALAAGFSTGTLHGDEAAAEEGLIVKDLGETGSGPPFGVGQMTSRTHKESPPFLPAILTYIRMISVCQGFFRMRIFSGKVVGA
jgi:hypothetical protein